MALPLSELFSVETRDSVVSTLLAIATSVQLRVTAWQPGQPLRTFFTLTGQKVADLTAQMAEAAKGGLLDSSTGDWLTLLAKSLYRVTRTPAQAAQADAAVTFTNASTSQKTYQPGGLIVAHAVTGKTYRNTALLVVNPGTTSAPFAVIADELGSASDAGVGMITSLVTNATGCSVTNVVSVLGADEESDEALRTRCRAKLGSLSPNGPKEAYAFVATTPYFEDGTPCCVTSVPVTRTQPFLDVLTGIFHLYIATASGAPSAPDVLVVDEALATWAEPWTVHSQADAATEVVFPITYQVWIRGSNLTVAQIKAQIASALAVYFSTVAIGGDVIPPDAGKIYLESIRTVIATATRGVVKVALSLPAGDTTMAVGQVAKLGTILATVTVVA